LSEKLFPLTVRVALTAAVVMTMAEKMAADGCKGNPNSLDEQLFSQDLVRGNPK
jgi:hypothetical protein